MIERSTYARVLRTLLLGLIVAAFAACDSSDGEGNGNGDGNGNGSGSGGKDRNVTAVWGEVENMNGAGLPGVTVSAGTATAVTGSDGKFELSVAAGETVLKFEKDGFLTQIDKVTVQSNKATAVQVTMRQIAAPVVLNMDGGGTATGERGAALTAAAGALVDASGTPVTGDVQVHLTPFDPSKADELAALPGELVAENEAGDQVILESFGVLDVTVMKDGQELDVADGQRVTIRIPAPEGVENPPAEIPIWSFDEARSIWIEEGVGSYIAADGVYEAEIGHFSYWNCDRTVEATCIKGVVQNESGDPVPGARVLASGVDYAGTTETTADENGEFCVVVRQNSRIRITASDGAGGVVQAEVDSGAEPTVQPPDCELCLDVGTFKLDRLTCAEVGNPFFDGCAAGLGEIFQCFRAEGACVIKSGSSFTNMTIEWANSASIRMEIGGDLTGGQYSVDGTYTGPNGETCGTYHAEGSSATADQESYAFDITTASGETYTITQSNENGDMTIQCPNGETTVMTQAQLDAWEVCADNQDTEECTWEDGSPFGGGGDGGSGGGGGGGICETDSDCDQFEGESGQDLECCAIGGASTCVAAGTCAGMPGSCSSDSDCPSGQSCCTFGGSFSACYPGACPQ